MLFLSEPKKADTNCRFIPSEHSLDVRTENRKKSRGLKLYSRSLQLNHIYSF